MHIKLFSIWRFIKSPISKNRPFSRKPELILKSLEVRQRYTYRALKTIQMKLKLLYVWAELAVLGSAKTALKFKYEFEIG